MPVVVIDDAGAAPELAGVLQDAGFGFIEITLRTPAAADAISRIRAAVPARVVGAGSVRSPEQMTEAVRAGAQFAVSPGASGALIAAAKELSLPFFPGAVSASEVLQLLESGYRLQKFFAAELAGGAAMLEALGGPLPEARRDHIPVVRFAEGVNRAVLFLYRRLIRTRMKALLVRELESVKKRRARIVVAARISSTICAVFISRAGAAVQVADTLRLAMRGAVPFQFSSAAAQVF